MEAIPGRDCPSGGQCCVSQNLSAENQFGANSSYHYGVVDLPGSPNMRQTHFSVGRPDYLLTTAVYTQSGDTLRKSGNPTVQPLKMFQFIIGEFKFCSLNQPSYAFTVFSANDTSTSATPTSASPATPSTDTLSADTSHTSNSSTETQVPSSSTSDASSSPPSSTVSHGSLTKLFCSDANTQLARFVC